MAKRKTVKKKKIPKKKIISVKNVIICALLFAIVFLFIRNVSNEDPIEETDPTNLTGEALQEFYRTLSSERRYLKPDMQLQFKHIQEKLDENPKRAELYFELGKIYFTAGLKWPDQEPREISVTYFKNATDKDPSLYDAYEGQGWMNLHMERFEDAYTSFQKASNLRETKESLVGLGWSHYGKSEFDKAILSFGRSFLADSSESGFPILLDANAGLGWSYYHLGKFSQAEDFLSKSSDSLAQIGLMASQFQLNKTPESTTLNLANITFYNVSSIGALNKETMECIDALINEDRLHECLSTHFWFGITI